MIGIVESRADEASEHVCEHLRRLGDFEERIDADRADAAGGGRYHRTDALELRSFDDLHLGIEDIAASFDDPAFVVFASRHAGDTGPLLSAHATGNFGAAEYGGEDRSLARAAPNALAAVLDALARHAPEAYDVSMECTHHGPTEVGAPSLFVELGSGPEEWEDPNGAEAVARAILDIADIAADAPRENGIRRHLVGVGGGHYAPRFTRIARETDWAVGHVAADWSLAELGDPDANSEVLDAAFEQSRAEVAVVEGDRPEIEATIEALGHRIASETWVRETDGVPLALVERAESRLGTVDDGLRFGTPATGVAADAAGEADAVDVDVTDAADAADVDATEAADVDATEADTTNADEPDCGGPDGGETDATSDELATIPLPNDLLDAAAGIDREATMAALADTCLAYETAEGGTRPGDRALVAGDGLPRPLVGRLAAILRERFDSITVEADRIVAEETAFDPALAKAAGVPEGPAFGRLSAGEAVEVDGERIEPEAVHERRRVTFALPGERPEA